MTDDNKLTLSRRKMLGSLGAIGVASAGAGLGTTAYFNDEESFDENTFTAGTLDMAVEGEIVAANQSYIDSVADVTGNPIEADGSVEMGFQVNDIKPGDWFIVQMTVDARNSNPFYVTLHAEDLLEKEGAVTDPEESADSSTAQAGWESVTNTNAELGDKLLVSYWEQLSGSNPNPGDLKNLDNITNTESNTFYSGFRQDLANGGEPDEDGVVPNQSSPPVGYTDVREFFYGLDQDPANSVSGNDPLGNGFASGDGILVGGVSNPVRVGRTDNISRRRLSDPDNDGESELVFYLCFELPEEVGNEIQGDALKGTFRVNAEQTRNNDDPRSGRS